LSDNAATHPITDNAMSAQRVRLITLDLDDTLWPCAPIIQAAEEAVHTWLQAHAPRLAEQHDIASMHRHRRQLMEQTPEIAHDLGLVRWRSLTQLLATHAYSTDLADAAMVVFLEHRNQVAPYPEVGSALRRLAARYCLISVTNGNANVEATPLRGIFHHSLTAADAGAAKPDPAIFRRALALAGCETHECLHLGDDPWTDVQAARDTGLIAAWINRTDRTWPTDLAPPSLTVADLDELAAWLDGGDAGDTDGV
jgi:FMN hydrolase / 5-amino-6-(5-phospho-D-ribitylamino)uracil phosphatase